jgi:hypothetical protein
MHTIDEAQISVLKHHLEERGKKLNKSILKNVSLQYLKDHQQALGSSYLYKVI